MAVANTAPIQLEPSQPKKAVRTKFLQLEGNEKPIFKQMVDDFNTLTDTLSSGYDAISPYIKAGTTVGGLLGTQFAINHIRRGPENGGYGMPDIEAANGFDVHGGDF
jgi:hypothetical protein